MKPEILKASLPLALSAAAFIIAKIMNRRISVPEDSSFENQLNPPPANSLEEFRDLESLDPLNSTRALLEEDGGQMITDRSLVGCLEIQGHPNPNEEILALRRQIGDLQEREWELAMRFLCYCDIKEQETRLLELRCMLLLEMAHAEFLNEEVSSMEAEKKRQEDLIAGYLRLVEWVESWQVENRLLHGEVKKLARKTKQQCRVIRDCKSKIESTEEEISRYQEELDRRNSCISELDDKVRELQANLNRAEEEKHQLTEKLTPSTSKSEAEGMAMADYSHLQNELECLRKDREAEVKELVYLRWSNACLRYELMKNQKPTEQNQESSQYSEEHESESSGETCSGVYNGSRPKILERLRRWVGGGEKVRSASEEEDEDETIKCFGRHSVSHKAEEHHVLKNNALSLVMTQHS